MIMTQRESSSANTKPDGFNILLRSAQLQESLEPRPIHPEVERQLRTLSHPSILTSPATAYILDRAMPFMLRTVGDDRFGVSDGSFHPRKKKKVFQENTSLHWTSIPQTKAIRQEETSEHSGFEKLIPTDTLKGVSKNDEHDVATSMVADATAPKMGHENYDTIDLPDPHRDTNTTHATPPAPSVSRRLLKLMKESEHSQSQLEDWDEDHGLPKSHCLTMVSSSRSRRQLQQGVILPKWDGTPLISQNVELGKPRKRRRRVSAQPAFSKFHYDSYR
jgi:hypothetical protein